MSLEFIYVDYWEYWYKPKTIFNKVNFVILDTAD